MNLTDYVKTVSIEDFGWKFKHQALWNKRLRTTGGRFFPRMAMILIPNSMRNMALKPFENCPYELCHYHLIFQGKGYSILIEISSLLAKVDGLRYAPKMQKRSGGELLHSIGVSCGHTYRHQTPCQYTEIWLQFVSRKLISKSVLKAGFS